MRRVVLPFLGLLLVAAAGYAAMLGYFGGPAIAIVPARAERADGIVAVFVSSDMGFNVGVGPRIADRLADQGIGVVAVNSLTAFAARQEPAAAAALVDRAVARALALPGARRVLLIGQSFGANIVLAAAPRMPAPLRARVAMVELVVPGETMLFRATPGGFFDTGHDGAALPWARRLTGAPVLCIRGEREAGSLCPLWRQANVREVALPGDHYLQQDDALIAATLVRAAADAPDITESSAPAQLAAIRPGA